MNEAEQIVRELIESDAEDLGTWKDLVPEPQSVQDLAKLKKYRPYIHHEYDHYYAPFVVPVWTPTGRLAKSKCWHGWYRMEGFTYANPPTWEQEVEAVGKLFPNRLPGFHPSKLQRLVRHGYRIGKPYDPYRQRFYESIDEALNPEVCAQCKGKCCAFYPGMTSPEDWGAPDQDLMRERITQAVASGKYDFDSWYGDPTGKSEDDADVWMVRPASERQPLGQLHQMGYERCKMMGDKGCDLAYGQRPRQCRELDPKAGGEGCGDQYSKKQAAIDWMPYQQLLHGIIYGTNESEDDFDAKDLTPLSAQEIELAAATEIADRLHQAGLKFVVKGDLATRAAAWPDLFKLVTLGKSAQFVLDQRLKNATTGQDYVRFWTIIPYTPDYGDYYTTWQWHLQDTVGKEHKLWLHNRGLVEVNIDVGESTQKEMVERLMVAIQEAKPVDRERLEKVYNKLYGQAADALSKRKPCAIDASTGRVTCLGSREGIYGNPTSAAKYGSGAEMDTLCCTGCTHHTPQGCAAEKPLACKTWLCPHAAVKNPELAKRLRDLQSRAMKAKVYEPRGDMPTAISRGLRSWQWAKEEPRVLRPDYEEPGDIDTWTDQEKWAEAERLFGPEPQEYLAYQDWIDRVEEWWYSGLGESRLQVIEGVGRVVGPVQEVRLVRWAATKHVPTGKIGKDFTHWDATEQLLRQGVIPGVNSLHDLDGMEDQNQATAFLQQLEDGYILDDGRFVTRDEGEQVAKEMGQLRGAETEKVEREAIDADDIDMDMDIEEAQGTPEPDYDAVARYAHAWFKKNARNFNDWPYEIGFALYWSPQGKVVPGTLVQGEAAEVEWPEQPELGIEVGSIHSHTGCSAELSDFDVEEGQKVANRTGQFYAMFVIGPDDDGEGVTMAEEVFEPENVNESVDDECDWKELVPDHLGHIKFMCPFTLVQREGQPLVKHYFSDEVGDWIEEFDRASIYQISDYAKNGVIDLNDCPMGTEAIINVAPDGQFLQEIPLDGACGWKIVDSYVPESEGDDFDVKEVTGEPVAYKVRYMCRRGRTYGYYWLTLTASTEEEALMRFQNWDWPDARARRVVSVEPVYSFHESADEDFDMKDVAPDPRIFTLHWHGFDGQWYHTKPLPSLERAIKLAFEWSLFTIKGDEAYIEEQHPEDPYNFIARHHLNDNYEVSNEEEGSSGRWFGVGEEPPLEEAKEPHTIPAAIQQGKDYYAPTMSPSLKVKFNVTPHPNRKGSGRSGWRKNRQIPPMPRTEAQSKPDVAALQRAMQQATQEIIDDPQVQIYGGKGKDGRRAASAYDINCGLCEEWGERVRQLYQEATGRDEVDVLDPGNLTGNPDDSLEGHIFLRLGDRFYDAECSQGVPDWKQLPLFVNNANLGEHVIEALLNEEDDDFDMKELTPESVRPVAFQLTFDFGAGEDGYSIQVFVPLEEFAPRFQTRDQIAAQWDEDMSMIEDTVIEYAQRTRTDIDRDDWSFMVGVDMLHADERQRGHMILVQNGDDPLVRCSVCGHQGNLMSDFSYLKAGFNGIQPGGADDLDLQECGACGAHLAWSDIRNANESEPTWVTFEELTPQQQAALYQYMVTDGGVTDEEYPEHVRKRRYLIAHVPAQEVAGALAKWGWEKWQGKLHPGDESRISKIKRLQKREGAWPYVVGDGHSFEEWAKDEMNHGDGYHRMVLKLRKGEPVEFLFMRSDVNESDDDFDAKELDLPVINPDLIVDEIKANGWPHASCVLAYPDEHVWMLEWNSPLELTHDMPQDEYDREADRAEAAGMAAVQKLYPQAENFEFYAPFSDGDFGLYFHMPGEYHPTRTGYVREAISRKKLFDGAVIQHPHFGKLVIRVTHRDNVIGHPELWQAIGEDGKPACPDAYSEQGLHRMLKWYWRYKPYYDFVNESERDTRTYKISARPDHLDQIEQLFHWINTTRGGHSGSAMLGIDGDGAARVEVEKVEGDLAKPDEEVKSRCDGKAEFEVYLESCQCQGCGHKFDYANVPEASMGAVHCPACASVVDQTGKLLEGDEDFDTKEVSNVELPQVPAYALADDTDAHGVQDRVDFNAVGWFLRADLDQIRKLAHCGWCRDYPADDVARDLAQDNHELAEFFERINGGFEVYVNQEAAEAFLKQFRSDVYDQLRAEHEILE